MKVSVNQKCSSRCCKGNFSVMSWMANQDKLSFPSNISFERLCFAYVSFVLGSENTKARTHTLAEGTRTNFVEHLNSVNMQCLLTDITHARHNSESVSKVEVNKICSQFSEIFNESITLTIKTTIPRKRHGLSASVRCKNIHPLLQRHASWLLVKMQKETQFHS